MATMRPGAASRQIQRVFADGTVAGLSDGQLLDRFFDGRDEAAFEALVARHGSMVLATCRGVLRDGRDVEDAFQATFLILIRKAGSVRGRDALGGWLHRVAHRVALQARADAERRRSRERRVAERGPTVAEPVDVGDDLRRVVHEELAMLSEAYRLPIVLCDLGDLTHAQAARELRWGQATLRRRLARARALLRDRLARRGLAPTVGLLGVALVPSSVPAAVVDSTVRAALRLAMGNPMTGAISPTVLALMKGVIRRMIVTKLKLSVAAVLAGGCLIASGSLLADRGLKASDLPEPRGREAAEARSAGAKLPPSAKPTDHPDPGGAKPWETAVRIKVLGRGWAGVGSGTIIQSTPEEAIILTCAHIFKFDGRRQPPPWRFPLRISVDLFDGRMDGNEPVISGYDINEAFEGEAIDFDFLHDLGLIRIRPKQLLPASRIVPADWKPRANLAMTTVGCSEGKDAAVLNTTISASRIMKGMTGNPDYEAILCEGTPAQGRSGGGLFTGDGDLAGVCNYAEPKGDHGLYATPGSIHRLLSRNGLTELVVAAEDRASGTLPTETDKGPESSSTAEIRAESPRNPVETTTTTYYVGDLIKLPGKPTPSGERPQVDMAPVIRLIVTSVGPGTWQGSDPEGQPIAGPDPSEDRKIGLITPFFLDLSLIIRHTPDVQDQVANRLRLLRTIVDDLGPRPTAENSNPDKMAVAGPKAKEETGQAGVLRAESEPFDPENDPDLKAELGLAEHLAEMRSATKSLPIVIERLESKLAAWNELLKKHNYGVPTELGQEPTEPEKKALDAAEQKMEELLGKCVEAKGKLSIARTMQTALERRLPDRHRPEKAQADQETCLKEVERKLDLVLKALAGKTAPGPD